MKDVHSVQTKCREESCTVINASTVLFNPREGTQECMYVAPGCSGFDVLDVWNEHERGGESEQVGGDNDYASEEMGGVFLHELHSEFVAVKDEDVFFAVMGVVEVEIGRKGRVIEIGVHVVRFNHSCCPLLSPVNAGLLFDLCMDSRYGWGRIKDGGFVCICCCLIEPELCPSVRPGECRAISTTSRRRDGRDDHNLEGEGSSFEGFQDLKPCVVNGKVIHLKETMHVEDGWTKQTVGDTFLPEWMTECGWRNGFAHGVEFERELFDCTCFDLSEWK